jgi:HTH-type transcriptional regulator / antitoxin HipB
MTDQTITSLQILGQTLRAARKKKKLTQSQLAQATGLNQKTVSEAENGSPGIRIETLFRLLSGLDLNLVLRVRTNAKKKHGEW